MAADLPPIGTRWGSLSAEQRRALPVGTVLSGWSDDWRRFEVRRVKAHRWQQVDDPSTTVWSSHLHPDRRILSYPELTPCPDPS